MSEWTVYQPRTPRQGIWKGLKQVLKRSSTDSTAAAGAAAAAGVAAGGRGDSQPEQTHQVRCACVVVVALWESLAVVLSTAGSYGGQ